MPTKPRPAVEEYQREKLEALEKAVDSYLAYLHTAKPLGSGEFTDEKQRVITLACNVADAFRKTP